MNSEKMRCHPSIILERSFVMILITFFMVLRSLDDVIDFFREFDGVYSWQVITGFLIYLGLFLIVVGVNFFSWFKTYIWIEDNTIIVERNTIFHKKNVYNIAQISNVDIEQNLFEMILNTNKIKIDSNSSVTAKSTDIKIVLSKNKAEKFRNMVLNGTDEINEKIEGEALNGEIPKYDVRREQSSYDISFTNKDVLKHTFCNINIFSILVALTGCAIAIGAFIFSGEDASIEDAIGDAIGGIFAFLVIIVPTIYSNIKPFFTYYGFEISRIDDKIKLHHGLFKYNENTIPLEKINGVIIKQPVIARIFKRYQVEIINVGMNDEKKESSNILLACSKEQLKKYMEILLPEYIDLAEVSVKRQPKISLIHYAYQIFLGTFVVTLGLIVMVKVIAGLALWIPLSIALIIFVLIVIAGILSYMAGGYYIAENYVIISRGVFSRTFTMIPYKKIQNIKSMFNFISKITKLNIMTCFITGQVFKSIIHFPYLPDEDLKQISERMKSSYCNI